MNDFTFREGSLYAENVAVSDIAARHGTPCYIYSRASLEAAANLADTGFYYYVVVDAEGRHGFSATLDEHNAKVAKARAEGVI